jgi:hypothetical protein
VVGSDIPGCGHVLLVVRLNCDLNFYGKVGTFINDSKYVCIEHHYSSVALLKKIHKTVSISKAFG